MLLYGNHCSFWLISGMSVFNFWHCSPAWTPGAAIRSKEVLSSAFEKFAPTWTWWWRFLLFVLQGKTLSILLKITVFSFQFSSLLYQLNYRAGLLSSIKLQGKFLSKLLKITIFFPSDSFICSTNWTIKDQITMVPLTFVSAAVTASWAAWKLAIFL